jgi:hypothetical protein
VETPVTLRSLVCFPSVVDDVGWVDEKMSVKHEKGMKMERRKCILY